MNRLCIFVCYDAEGIYRERDLYYVEQLASHTHKLIIATNIADTENIKQQSPESCDVMCFKNDGYDFGYVDKVLRCTDISEYDELLVVNNSVICFNSLDRLFAMIDGLEGDLVGITKSNEIQEHIQSFFWLIRGKWVSLFKNHIITTYDGMYKTWLFTDKIIKMQIILNIEVGFPQFVLSEGGNINAVLKAEPDYFLNMSIVRFMEITSVGIPLIKKHVIKEIPRWQQILMNGYDKKLNYTKLISNL